MVFQLDQKVPPSAQSDQLDSTEIFDERESNVRSYSRSFPAVFSHARGAFLYDTEALATSTSSPAPAR
jgi:4-aminobutyrate aminotransferase-like enzyme